MEYPYVSLPIDSELKNEAGAKFSTEILDVGSSVELSFHDIEYAVPMKSKSNKYAVKKILRPMSGVIQPGVMTAIMGSTGSGKTSLLDVLAQRKEPSYVTGQVLVNAEPINVRTFKRVCAYVVQHDVLTGTLTVRENLLFSAKLRLPSSVSLRNKEKRVNHIIHLLKLEKCANSAIGTEMIRGVSGGERKRCMIGMELITNPLILFLDEPTTGLDSSTACDVIDALAGLGRKGHTIVLSIHQPRFSIFKQFQQLILLHDGQIVYQGATSNAVRYFERIGHPCEQFNNPADHFLDVVIKTSRSERRAWMKRRNLKQGEYDDLSISLSMNGGGRGNGNDSADKTGNGDGVTDKDGGYGHAEKEYSYSRNSSSENSYSYDMDEEDMEHALLPASSLVEAYNDSDMNIYIQSRLSEIMDQNGEASASSPSNISPSTSFFFSGKSNKHIHDMDEYAVGFWTQLAVVGKRTVDNVVRNPATVFLQLFVNIIFSCLVGSIYFQLAPDQKGIQNRTGAIFFIVMNMMYGNLSAIELFLNERAIFVHEKCSGYYRTSVYFLSKILCDILPLRLFPTMLFGTITYWMIGFQPDLTKFFAFLFGLVMTSISSAALCFMFSSVVDLFAIANLLVALSYTFFMVFGGLLLNLDDIPVAFKWLEYLSIFRYAFHALTKNELQGLELTCTPAEKQAGQCVEHGDQALDALGLNDWGLAVDFIAMGIMTVVYMLFAYVALRRLKRT